MDPFRVLGDDPAQGEHADPASRTESGDATPAPFPVALMMPTISGMMKAVEKTGPMNPTDCATTSTSDNFAPPRRS